MSQNLPKIALGILLAAWCIFETVSGITDPNTRSDAFSNLVGFIIVILPFLVILFWMSFSIYNNSKGGLKAFGAIGVLIGISIVLVNVGSIMWSIIRILIP